MATKFNLLKVKILQFIGYGKSNFTRMLTTIFKERYITDIRKRPLILCFISGFSLVFVGMFMLTGSDTVKNISAVPINTGSTLLAVPLLYFFYEKSNIFKALTEKNKIIADSVELLKLDTDDIIRNIRLLILPRYHHVRIDEDIEYIKSIVSGEIEKDISCHKFLAGDLFVIKSFFNNALIGRMKRYLKYDYISPEDKKNILEIVFELESLREIVGSGNLWEKIHLSVSDYCAYYPESIIDNNTGQVTVNIVKLCKKDKVEFDESGFINEKNDNIFCLSEYHVKTIEMAVINIVNSVQSMSILKK